ncbi:MAG: CBS domain-containing protein [Bdellovibrionales bacterium]
MHADENPSTLHTGQGALAGESNVVCVRPDSPVTEAVSLMREHHVGDVVVVEQGEGGYKPVGVLTDRDVALEIVATGRDPREVLVRDLMTRSVATAAMEDDLFTMLEIMKANGVTRLPVVDERGDLAGIVTTRTLFEVLLDGLMDLAEISERQHREEEVRGEH